MSTNNENNTNKQDTMGCESSDSDRIEEELHEQHVREERILHDANVRTEEEIHQLHMREEEEIHQKHHPAPTLIVKAPSGAPKTFNYHAGEKVGTLLQAAVQAFGQEGQIDPSHAYLLACGETPLDNNTTLEEAGVMPCATLNLRASKIPSDGDAS